MELLICRYSDDVWWLLASSSAFNVRVEHLTDAFAVTYSENGANNRTKEEAIVYFWYEYISECSGVLCSSFASFTFPDLHKMPVCLSLTVM